MQVEITKRNGIDGLLSGYSSGKVEEEKEITTEEGLIFPHLFNKYTEFRYNYELTRNPLFTYFPPQPILTPKEINPVLRYINAREGYENNFPCVMLFIRKLIENSYLDGHQHFSLNLSGLPEIEDTFTHLRADKMRPLHLKLTGDIGHKMFCYSHHVNIVNKGNVGKNLGSCVHQSSFSIYGYIDSFCGSCAHQSSYHIYGSARETLAYGATNSQFTIHGNVIRPIGIYSKGCVFRSSNKKTIKKLLQDVPDHGNKVFYIKKSGNEERVL